MSSIWQDRISPARSPVLSHAFQTRGHSGPGPEDKTRGNDHLTRAAGQGPAAQGRARAVRWSSPTTASPGPLWLIPDSVLSSSFNAKRAPNRTYPRPLISLPGPSKPNRIAGSVHRSPAMASLTLPPAPPNPRQDAIDLHKAFKGPLRHHFPPRVLAPKSPFSPPPPAISRVR